ncbi:DUF6587 family protein [Acinetobacter stercoris]|uniref:Uncharacterized protein n=1 Tax=Acinetobacter stercoris TaxID=2126983 RepID=A0A2U3MWU2_9GAMM|nr:MULTISPECIES: DUF6587 family protein [Acinetobacter]SPL69769.1 hypothetical protein KPC_0947 [Acinetobacter stercoris]
MIELLIVAALVIWSAIIAFNKIFPKTAYAVYFKLAQIAEQQGWSTLAKWLRPKMATGCGGSCGCGNSESESVAVKKTEVQAVKWK